MHERIKKVTLKTDTPMQKVSVCCHKALAVMLGALILTAENFESREALNHEKPCILMVTRLPDALLAYLLSFRATSPPGSALGRTRRAATRLGQ